MEQLAPDRLSDEAFIDEFDDGSLLLILKAFEMEPVSRWYHFGAVKSGGRWYVTNYNHPHGMTTQEFIRWLLRGSRLAPTPQVFWAKTVYEI